MGWCRAYSWKKSTRRNFVVPFTKEELEQRLADAWVSTAMPWALTLLSGAQRRVVHVQNASSTYVYAIAARPEDLAQALSALHANEVEAPVPGTHLLCVLEPWYGHAALFGVQTLGGLPVVSDLQLFLDLVHYPLRGAESAVQLLRSRIAMGIGMSANDMARVERSIG